MYPDGISSVLNIRASSFDDYGIGHASLNAAYFATDHPLEKSLDFIGAQIPVIDNEECSNFCNRSLEV